MEHLFNVLGRLNAAPVPPAAATHLNATTPLLADTARYDRLPAEGSGADFIDATAEGAAIKSEVLFELKALRLHGMAGAWADLVGQCGNAGLKSLRWLIGRLLQAEGTDRSSVRSATR